jgi:MFS family permease
MTAIDTADTRPRERAGGTPAAGAVVSHGVAFWLVGYAFTVVMSFAAVPTPLYVLYAQRDHWSPVIVTCVFAAYAVGVMVSLPLLGHVSDRVGRRPMLLAATGLSLLAGIVFIAWTSLPALLLARILSGVAVGIVTPSATAHAGELHAAHRPDASARRAQVVATAANLGGIGLGPLLSGVLAQLTPRPLLTPYLVSEGLLALAVVAFALSPETVRRDGTGGYRVQRLVVPSAARGRFVAASVGVAVIFTIFGLFGALVPGFLAGTLHETSRALAGAVAAAVFLASAAVQMAFPRVPRIALPAGGAVATAGLATLTVATWTARLPLFVVGAVATGAGAGLLFMALLATVIDMAPAGHRAEVLSAFFFSGYLGLAVPVVLLGVLDEMVSTAVLMTTVAAAAALALTAMVSAVGRADHDHANPAGDDPSTTANRHSSARGPGTPAASGRRRPCAPAGGPARRDE